MKTLSWLASLLAAFAFVFVLPALAQSTKNFMDASKWSVGGTLEVSPNGIFRLDTGTKTVAATSGAATLNKLAGVVTSEALTTAFATNYTLTITDSRVAAADQVFASVSNGTNTTGVPALVSVKPAAGSFVVTIRNVDAADPFNGTLKVAFFILKN